MAQDNSDYFFLLPIYTGVAGGLCWLTAVPQSPWLMGAQTGKGTGNAVSVLALNAPSGRSLSSSPTLLWPKQVSWLLLPGGVEDQ